MSDLEAATEEGAGEGGGVCLGVAVEEWAEFVGDGFVSGAVSAGVFFPDAACGGVVFIEDDEDGLGAEGALDGGESRAEVFEGEGGEGGAGGEFGLCGQEVEDEVAAAAMFEVAELIDEGGEDVGGACEVEGIEELEEIFAGVGSAGGLFVGEVRGDGGCVEEFAGGPGGGPEDESAGHAAGAGKEGEHGGMVGEAGGETQKSKLKTRNAKRAT